MLFRLRKIMRPSSLFHTLQVPKDTPPPPKKSFWGRLRCKHLNEVHYTRIDHTKGPGWMSDAYAGEYCGDCATILRDEKIY